MRTCRVPGHTLRVSLGEVGVPPRHGTLAAEALMGPCVIVVLQKQPQHPDAGQRRARPPDAKTFVVDRFDEPLHVAVRRGTPRSDQAVFVQCPRFTGPAETTSAAVRDRQTAW